MLAQRNELLGRASQYGDGGPDIEQIPDARRTASRVCYFAVAWRALTTSTAQYGAAAAWR